jgi:predicted transcriptional regulator
MLRGINHLKALFNAQTRNRLRKPYLKQQYRSGIGIITDILGAAIDGGRHGVIASDISRRANLSHCTMIEKCQKLINAGLIDLRQIERKTLFCVTEKGIWFFHELQRFQDVAKTMKIRC